MMKRSTLVFAVSSVLVLFLVVAGGCKKEAAAPAPAAQMQAGMPMPQAVALSGKVLETMNSGGYTYVNLENNGQKTWVAIPATPVKVGQELKCQPGMEMTNFTSKTLKRTFASIYFSGGAMK